MQELTEKQETLDSLSNKIITLQEEVASSDVKQEVSQDVLLACTLYTSHPLVVSVLAGVCVCVLHTDTSL